MEFDGFALLRDERGVKEMEKGAVRGKLEVEEGCGVPASDKEGGASSATPGFPPHRNLKQSIIRARSPLAHLTRQALGRCIRSGFFF